ncbi:hypothetical protein TWF694_004699 [Orbilia ellipsospora]|uniref:Uncharacterized protein n=1 Tax=Orbilia ellipsospora TaxID=2528407 RepID=A0AAV9WW11_9PEZI
MVSESSAQLIRDKDLWVDGTGGATLVVLIHIKERPNTASKYEASLEVCKGAINHRVTVYPELLDNESDPEIALSDLYRNKLLPEGNDAQTKLPLPRKHLQLSLIKAVDQLTFQDEKTD